MVDGALTRGPFANERSLYCVEIFGNDQDWLACNLQVRCASHDRSVRRVHTPQLEWTVITTVVIFYGRVSGAANILSSTCLSLVFVLLPFLIHFFV